MLLGIPGSELTSFFHIDDTWGEYAPLTLMRRFSKGGGSEIVAGDTADRTKSE